MKTILLAALFILATDAKALDCARQAGSLPDPEHAVGHVNAAIPVEHIVVIMQENHSFDNYFGSLAKGAYKGDVDGLSPEVEKKLHHAERPCLADPVHNWNAMHLSWDHGKNDGFELKNGKLVMTYFEQKDIPYYYALADRFAIADRYFASVLSQTYPNRLFLMAGTAFGQVANIDPKSDGEYDHKTIFDVMGENGVSWKYYPVKEDYIKLFRPTHARYHDRIVANSEFKKDVAEGKLPQVAFLESSEVAGQDEHPAANIQIGQAWVADKINAIMNSDYWPKTAIFLTYDEGGGFYDHVPPPEACAPDDIEPNIGSGRLPGDYKRLGFRVPFVAISPYSKRHFVSHKTYEHTSILKFIETKFNLPALTRRDANADPLLELFDFSNPVADRGPLPKAEVELGRDAKCH